MRALAGLVPLSALLALAACSGSSATDPASGRSELDAGIVAPGDAAEVLDAAAPDAREAVDGGVAPDATPARDAEPTDARLVIDAGADCPAPLGEGVPFRLRAMAANLTSGNLQSYDPGDGLRIMMGLRPDVVLVQELNYGDGSPEAIEQMVIDTFGEGWSYARGLGGQIPNGVLSRWPIVESGDWADPEVGNRAFTWAHIDLPGARDLWAISVHLLTSRASSRTAEGRALLAALDAHVPRGDFILIGGDFNTESHTEGVFDTLRARMITAAPYPADATGDTTTNGGRTKPYDAVLASPCLFASQVPVEIGAQSFAAGLVFDSRIYQPLADVSPIRQEDSDAPNMQHMAVVKDFLIQP